MSLLQIFSYDFSLVISCPVYLQVLCHVLHSEIHICAAWKLHVFQFETVCKATCISAQQRKQKVLSVLQEKLEQEMEGAENQTKPNSSIQTPRP